MRKRRHRKVNCLAQGCTAGKWWSWGLNSGSLDPDSPQNTKGMLGILNSATNSAKPMTQFCRIPHSTLISNPHPSCAVTEPFTHLLHAKCFTVPLANGHRHPVSILQTGKLRLREVMRLIEGHMAHKGHSWDLNPDQSLAQPPLGLPVISQSTCPRTRNCKPSLKSSSS